MGFDWGNDEDNILHHGTKDPPQYDLTAVNARVALYWSDGDWLAQPEVLSLLENPKNHLYVYIQQTGFGTVSLYLELQLPDQLKRK